MKRVHSGDCVAAYGPENAGEREREAKRDLYAAALYIARRATCRATRYLGHREKVTGSRFQPRCSALVEWACYELVSPQVQQAVSCSGMRYRIYR